MNSLKLYKNKDKKEMSQVNNKQREEENDRLFKEWMKQNCVQCPKCRLAIQRIGGCNWIYCSPDVGGCGTKFCYKCGKEVDHYSPHILSNDCSQSPTEK